MSFNEGNVTNVLEIVSKKKIDLIEKSEHLANYFAETNSDQHTYKLIFNNRKSLVEFKERLKNDQNIEKINIAFN